MGINYVVKFHVMVIIIIITIPEPSRSNLSGDKYTFCSKCFDAVKGDSIFVGDDPAQTLVEITKTFIYTSRKMIFKNLKQWLIVLFVHVVGIKFVHYI